MLSLISALNKTFKGENGSKIFEKFDCHLKGFEEILNNL